MSDAVEEKGVNNDGIEDNVTHDHDAGVGSPANEMETHQLDIDDYDDIIDLANAANEDASSGETEKTVDSEATSDDKSSKDEADDTDARVPKSRLDEVISQRKERDEEIIKLREELARERGAFEARLSAMDQSRRSPEAPQSNPFEEMLNGNEPQAILDAMQEDPANFFKNLQAVSNKQAAEALRQEAAEKAYYDNLSRGLDAFADEHDGFRSELNRLGEVMDRNPIHNLVSAYAYEVEIPAMKQEHDQAIAELNGKIEAAKAEGIKLGKAEALKAVQSKSQSTVLDGSQSQQGAKVSGDPALQDTEKSGGLRQILTEKVLRMRAGK